MTNLDTFLEIAIQSAKNYQSDNDSIIAEPTEAYRTQSTISDTPPCWEEIRTILTVIYENPSLAPSARRKELKGKPFTDIVTQSEALVKTYLDFWIIKYYRGYEIDHPKK